MNSFLKSQHSIVFFFFSIIFYHKLNPDDVNEGQGIYRHFSSKYSEEYFLKFRNENPELKVFFYDTTNAFQKPETNFLDERIYVPEFGSNFPERSDLHPKPHIHEWHAENLFQILKDDDWLQD